MVGPKRFHFHYSIAIVIVTLLVFVLQGAAQGADYAEATLRYGGSVETVQSVSDISESDFDIKVGSDKTYDVTGEESDIIFRNGYFYLKDYGLFQYKGADKSSSSSNVIKFRDMKTGTSVENTYSLSCDIKTAETTLNLAGKSYKVASSSEIIQNDFSVKVDVSGDGIIGNYDRFIVGDESDAISRNDYFYLYDYGLLRYKGSDKITADSPIIKFQNITSGDTIEMSLESCAFKAIQANLNTAYVTYNLVSASDPSQNDFSIKIKNITGQIWNDIVGQESEIISRNDYFYLKGIGMFRYKGASSVTDSYPAIKFQDMNTRNAATQWAISGNEGEEIGSIKYGGNIFKIVAASATTLSDFDIKIDLDASGTIGDYGITIFGEAAEPILQRNDYVLLNDYTTLLQYKGADKYTDASPVIKFVNVTAGETIEIAYEGCPDTSSKATLHLGGKIYGVKSVSDPFSSDFDIKVDLNGDGTIGNYAQNVIGSESASVQRNDYVYLNGHGAVRYKGADKSTSDSPVIKFQDVGTGDSIELAYPACPSNSASANILIGGRTYAVKSASDVSESDFDIEVDMNYDGTIGNYAVDIAKNSGSSISKNDYFIFWGSSYPLLRYSGATNAGSADNVIKFYDVGQGSTIEIAYQVVSKPIEVPPQAPTSSLPALPEETPPEASAPTASECANGCVVDSACIPVAVRTDDQYCDIDKSLKQQKSVEESCQNNYECFTNQCSNGKCIDLERELKETQNLLQKILRWFARLFWAG